MPENEVAEVLPRSLQLEPRLGNHSSMMKMRDKSLPSRSKEVGKYRTLLRTSKGWAQLASRTCKTPSTRPLMIKLAASVGVKMKVSTMNLSTFITGKNAPCSLNAGNVARSLR
jgi:hypothetical protein